MSTNDPPALDPEALAALEREATPGPWRLRLDEPCSIFDAVTRHVGYCSGRREDKEDFCNAALIVALRNAAPSILAELRQARSVVALAHAYQAAHNDYRGARMLDGLRSDDAFHDLVADVDARAEAWEAAKVARAALFAALDAALAGGGT